MNGVMYYTARTQDGAFVSGSVQALDEPQILRELFARGLFITSLGPGRSLSGNIGSLFTLLPHSRSARRAFLRALATLVSSAIPLHRALHLCEQQIPDRRLREAVGGVGNDLASGSSLSAAMERRPHDFDRFMIAMVRSGETAGTLEDVLTRLCEVFEREDRTQSRLVSALVYPLFVALCACGLFAFLIISVVPTFAALFRQMNVAIPKSTQALIALGAWLREPVALLCCLAVLVLIPLAGSRLLLNPAVKVRMERILWKVPVLGRLCSMVMHERLSRTLGALLQSGVHIVSACDTLTDVFGVGAMSASIHRICASVKAGSSFSASLGAEPWLDVLFVEACQVGEETGSLDRLLLRLANHYEVEIDSALTNLLSLVEPILIILIGIGIGVLISSLLVPLYNMIGNIR